MKYTTTLGCLVAQALLLADFVPENLLFDYLSGRPGALFGFLGFAAFSSRLCAEVGASGVEVCRGGVAGESVNQSLS